MSSDFELTDDTPVYVISVAAQLSGLHPQTLRTYDRLGLVSPGRAAGKGRRYSLRDILILREVQRMSQEDNINLSGIKRILELETEWQRSRIMIAEMQAEIDSSATNSSPRVPWPPGSLRCCGKRPRAARSSQCTSTAVKTAAREQPGRRPTSGQGVIDDRKSL